MEDRTAQSCTGNGGQDSAELHWEWRTGQHRVALGIVDRTAQSCIGNRGQDTDPMSDAKLALKFVRSETDRTPDGVKSHLDDFFATQTGPGFCPDLCKLIIGSP